MGTYRGWGRPSYRSYGGGYGGFGFVMTPMVKKLILINAGVFLFTLFLGFSQGLYSLFLTEFGLVPRQFLFGFRLWQPVTYLFLHGGFFHILINMLFLWMFGSVLERDWGSRRFLRYYFLTGVGAGLFSVAVTAGGVWLGLVGTKGINPMVVPTIGASGAIYGVLLAFGLLYPHTPIYLWFLIPVPARIFVLISGLIAFMSALQGPGSGIAHVAHLGGMLFGLFYLYGGLRGLYARGLRGYADWRLRQARRKFDVYLREEEERRRRGPDQWIH